MPARCRRASSLYPATGVDPVATPNDVGDVCVTQSSTVSARRWAASLGPSTRITSMSSPSSPQSDLCLPLRLLYRNPAVCRNSWCAGSILRPAHTAVCDGQKATVCDLPPVEIDWLAPSLRPAVAHAVMDACFS